MKYFLPFVVAFLLPVAAFADYTLTTGGGGTTLIQNVNGTGGGSEQSAQPFTTTFAGTATSAVVYLLKAGTPSDNTCVDIYAWTGSAPTGSSLGQACIASTGLTGSGAPYTFAFGSPVSMSASSQYAYVVSRSGARDTDNHPSIAGSASPTTLYNESSSVWSNAGNGEANTGIFITVAVPAPAMTGPAEVWGDSYVAASSTFSLVDNPTQDFFMGVVLFLCTMFGILYLFKLGS